MRRVALVVLLVLGCLDADRIELQLLTAPTFRESALDALSVRVFDASGTLVASGSSEQRGTLFDLGALDVDESYVLEVNATVEDCSLGRAGGLSMPFVHRGGSYSIPVQIGCADEFSATRNRPSTGRLSAGLVTDREGGGVLMGGSAALVLSATSLNIMGPERAVDRYDPRLGLFRPIGQLATPRAWPAAVALPDGDVAAAIGGVLPALPVCESSVEIATGEITRVAATLSVPRCTASAAFLPTAGVTLVAGGTSNRTNRDIDAEALSPDLDEVVVPGIRGQTFRTSPAIVPLSDGERAVLIGGIPEGNGARAEIVSFGPGCADGGPCTSAVPVDDAPTGAWTEVSASYVPCGDGTGAIFAAGGQDDMRALTGLWCARDSGDSMGFTRIGELPDRRTRHKQVTVRGTSGRRLMLIGGARNSSLTLGVHDDALLIEADGCTCSVGAVEQRALPITGVPVFHSATVLGDDTVLVVGGVRVTLEGEAARIAATGEAALFTPDRGAF